MAYNDPERLQAVCRFLKLDINRKAEMQEMVELAASICDTPVAMITLLDEQTEYIRFRKGTEIQELLREETFSQYLIQSDDLLIIKNTPDDPRFRGSHLVISEPFIRFYAGCPLITHDGYRVGSLCVMGQISKDLDEPQKHLLNVLAKRIVEIMEMEFSLDIVKNQFLQVKDSEIKLQSFFESAGTCHMLISKDMNVIAFNKNISDFVEAWHHIKIYPGLNITQIIHGKQFDDFANEFRKALGGNPVYYEREIDYGGEKIWWSIILEPGYNSDREIIGISFNATNVTEKKNHEREMIEKNEQLMQIAHIQSHELRKPVASILGLMELFKAGDYSSTREELMMLERAAIDLDTRIRAIVQLTR